MISNFSINSILKKTISRIKNGYLQFFNKRNRKWVWLHRFIAQIFYGKPIPTGHEVHHIDKNKLNNSPNNLMVISKEEHRRIHSYDRSKLKDGIRFFNKVRKFDSISFEQTNRNHLKTNNFNKYLNGTELNTNNRTCPKCLGTGYLPHYKRIQNGICFRCSGTGKRQC